MRDPSQVVSGAAEPTDPFPPRFWWLKRLAAAGVVAAVALVALWHWWDREAQRRLDAYLRAARDRGEPLVAADFDPPAVPPDQDAVALYRQAVQGLTRPHARDVVEEAVIPFTPAELGRLQTYLQAESPSLAQARAARALPGRDGAALGGQPLLARRWSGPPPSWQLVPLLHWQALYRHQTGDDAEAVEAVRDILALSDVTQRDTGYPYAAYMAGEVDHLAVNAVSQIAPTLGVQGDAAASTRPRQNAASAAQVGALIRELLDERPMQEALVRSIRLRRALALEALPSLTLGPGAPELLKPAWKADAVNLMKRFDATVRAAGQPTYPAARATLPPPPPHRASRLESVARGVSRFDELDRSLRWHYRRLGDRRLAAVALAARLYRANHAGDWPLTLESLVPVYLPAVPADPFDRQGGPLRYLLTGPAGTVSADGSSAPPAPPGQAGTTGPVVYSVGEDGIDQGGSRETQLARSRFWRWGWEDAVLLLAENPEVREAADDETSSGEAQDHDAEKGDGGGKDDESQDRQQQPQDRQ